MTDTGKLMAHKELDRLLLADFQENEQVWKEKGSIIVDNRKAKIKNQFIGGNFNNPVFE